AGGIGLPHPGVELKLLPLDEGRFEIRARSPAVTTGYLHAPALTAEAFDEEGFFRMGDAVRFIDPERPEEGLAFAGRVAEEFKLQSGVFVRVGALRVDAIESAGGLLSDVVVAGSDQAFVGLLAWPNLAACRAKCGRPEATLGELVDSYWLRQAVLAAFRAHNQSHPASSMQIRRVLLLAEPPSMAAGEITDKGYINQRAVLQRRAALAARLYASPRDPEVIAID
ncbi:MAG: AMP-dependent synthetase and ligase, partial [Ramlibacter sp.]|nr:AMP-dependent synthetase and ligase [Ramlibacter sp.]